MAKAKDIHVAPVSRKDADAAIKRLHYSGKVVPNSQLHFGVWLNGRLEGAMQFGPSLDKGKMVGLVEGTRWNGFLELNRLAFSDNLPRNSESRALSIAFKLIRKYYPHIEWVVSFADGTQCGDGTIYRASGFVLTGIKRNGQIIEFPDGLIETRMTLTLSQGARRSELAKRYGAEVGGDSSLKPFLDIGARPMEGYQLRYIYFTQPNARERLTVPVIPYERIGELGAGMYKGEKTMRGKKATSGDHPESGGATPTSPLHIEGGGDD